MTPAALRGWCLRLDEAIEDFPFGPEFSVFRHAGNTKVFAITDLGAAPLAVTVKCDPDEAEALRASYDSIVPGYHTNKRHWITVTVGGDADDELVRELIDGSYDLIKPRARTRR